MSAPTILVSVDDHVATIRLDRPRQANALDESTWSRLREAIRQIDADRTVRVAVIAGAGRNFCAGIDLSMLDRINQLVSPDRCDGRAREDLRHLLLDLQDVFTAVERCRVLVLAAIHGACLGAGLDLAAACDLRYSTVDARCALVEVNLGVTADVGGLQRLPGIIGEGRTRELAYTARDVSGIEARAIGLVNECFDDQVQLMDHVTEIARTIAAKSPLAIRGTKLAITYARDHSTADGVDQMATWNAATLVSDDLAEALRATAAGRPPVFGD